MVDIDKFKGASQGLRSAIRRIGNKVDVVDRAERSIDGGGHPQEIELELRDVGKEVEEIVGCFNSMLEAMGLAKRQF